MIFHDREQTEAFMREETDDPGVVQVVRGGVQWPAIRDEEWADRTFPDRGEAPSNEVVVDPNAQPAPNITHPE
jgi:hypothetical protein